MKIKVGVIFGGNSVEHEVSIITACQAMSYINKEKYDVVPIYISKDRTWYTGKIDMEFFHKQGAHINGADMKMVC